MKQNTVAGPRPNCTALPHFPCLLDVQISLRGAATSVNRVYSSSRLVTLCLSLVAFPLSDELEWNSAANSLPPSTCSTLTGNGVRSSCETRREAPMQMENEIRG